MNNFTLLSGAVVGLIVWMLLLTFFLIQERRYFKSLAKGVTKKDLISLLKQISTSLAASSSKIESINHQLEVIKSDNLSHLQKIGFIRFNPFSDTGGDQSFCLCLLDQNNNGIVITSLHSRETTRIYGKVISGPLNRAECSAEEWKAYQEAIKANIFNNS